MFKRILGDLFDILMVTSIGFVLAYAIFMWSTGG